MPPPETNLYEHDHLLDSNFSTNQDEVFQTYPIEKCIVYPENRTGSWGLPSLYISTSIGMSNSSLTLPHDSNNSLPNEYCKKYISMGKNVNIFF